MHLNLLASVANCTTQLKMITCLSQCCSEIADAIHVSFLCGSFLSVTAAYSVSKLLNLHNDSYLYAQYSEKVSRTSCL